MEEVQMKIEYENSFKDLLLFSIVHQFLSPVIQFFLLLLVAYIVFTEVSVVGRSLIAAIVVAFIWYLGLWIFQLFFNTVYQYSKKSKSVLTKHIIEIQDEAFYEETKYNRSYFYWTGIVKVVKRPGFVGVYVTPDAAHIIPNRAFASHQQASAFVDEIKLRLCSA